jgi:hypothetical protein
LLCGTHCSFASQVTPELQKEVEQARRKLLVHAPPVSSPLRRRVSSKTILAAAASAGVSSLSTAADEDAGR